MPLTTTIKARFTVCTEDGEVLDTQLIEVKVFDTEMPNVDYIHRITRDARAATAEMVTDAIRCLWHRR